MTALDQTASVPAHDLTTIPSAEAADASVSIIGLGYVGAVSAACFTDLWRRVIGVDVDHEKIRTVGDGRSPIVEPELDALLGEAVALGMLDATDDIEGAVLATDISFVCVGTPSAVDGSCDLTWLKDAMRRIGAGMAMKAGSRTARPGPGTADRHVVAIRSTIPPRATREHLIPILESASGLTAGEDFGVVFHPEFLREGTAVEDFRTPPKTVIGGDDAWAVDAVAALYRGVDDHVIRTALEAAEMVKYVDNTWHAVKVCFANEIGKVCQSVGVDSHDVMDVFVQDVKLNISPYYMKPGFAFGGSCLPKDVRGMNTLARRGAVDTPLLNAVIPSNEAQILHAIHLINRTGASRIGFLGVTFKADTDDLRESPILRLIEALLRQGVELIAYDPNVNLDTGLRHHAMHAKAGAGTGGLTDALPHIMTRDLDALLDRAETLVVSHRTPLFRAAVENRRADQHCVDLIRLFDRPEETPGYQGVCW